jgi:hypothetical protein
LPALAAEEKGKNTMNVPHPFSALLISAAPEAILIFASVIILSIHSSRRLDKLSPLGSFSHLLALSGCFPLPHSGRILLLYSHSDTGRQMD